MSGEGLVRALELLGLVLLALGGCYAAGSLVAVARAPWRGSAFVSGREPAEHAFSRYHVRWYPVTMVFLAFDMEMLFMYPWVRVVSEVGTSAVVEMFVFLGILLAGVTYAWREGAFRWT
ncbi:MAG: NADH-quinone oxidoreductase subunit A [Thermoleophilia bacterium]